MHPSPAQCLGSHIGSLRQTWTERVRRWPRAPRPSSWQPLTCQIRETMIRSPLRISIQRVRKSPGEPWEVILWFFSTACQNLLVGLYGSVIPFKPCQMSLTPMRMLMRSGSRSRQSRFQRPPIDAPCCLKFPDCEGSVEFGFFDQQLGCGHPAYPFPKYFWSLGCGLICFGPHR